VLFASQAVTAIVNARSHRYGQRAGRPPGAGRALAGRRRGVRRADRPAGVGGRVHRRGFAHSGTADRGSLRWMLMFIKSLSAVRLLASIKPAVMTGEAGEIGVRHHCGSACRQESPSLELPPVGQLPG
jgi:hypothetical protein